MSITGPSLVVRVVKVAQLRFGPTPWNMMSDGIRLLETLGGRSHVAGSDRPEDGRSLLDVITAAGKRQ